MHITELVIGSGGARGMVALGALQTLQREGLLTHVHTYHGTSVGALLCAGLMLGRPCKGMMNRIVKYPLRPEMECRNGFGLDHGLSLVRFIRRILSVSHEMTLQDLYESTGKTLYICVCNLTKQRIEYWSHETHPTMSLIRALRCSCGIPLLFRPCRIGDDLYVDGAVGRHQPRAKEPKTTLTIHFASPPVTVQSWPDYMKALGNIGDVVQTRFDLPLDASGVDPFSFEFSKESAQVHYSSGKTQALLFIKKNM
jgi:hypothetical protein